MATFPNQTRSVTSAPTQTSKQKGDAAEDAAWAFLQSQGMQLLHRNYRTRGRGGGEIDLIVRDPKGTLVFVEVRSRAQARQGGALASVGRVKQQRLLFAARCFLSQWPEWPPCRFDVVAWEAGQLHWVQSAFEA